MPSHQPKASLRKLQIVPAAPIGQCRRSMPDSLLIMIASAFLLAGFVKGAIGLGLPTVSMGLLAVTMPPGQAIAIVIVPAIVTNIWQTFGGPYLRDIMRRLWPLMAGTAIRHLAQRRAADRPLCPLRHRRARHIAGDLRDAIGLGQISFKVARRHREMGRRHRRPDHRRGFGRHRRSGDPVGSLHAGDRHGEGRTGAGARRVLHGRDRGARPSISPQRDF